MTRRKRPRIVALAPAHLVGLGAFQIAVVLAFFNLCAAIIPLAAFAVLCAIAPFFPQWNFYLPVSSHGQRDRRWVSLTFDDGPHPQTTSRLLEVLAAHSVHAAFFVTGRAASEHLELVREILDAGHEIGNHTLSHDVFLMLRNRSTLTREITRCQEALFPLGVRPLAFRPPVGIVNPRLWRVLIELGMFCVTFGCRGGDRGNRRIEGIARRVLRSVRPGDIVLLHDTPPTGGSTEQLLGEVDALIRGLKEMGLQHVPLSTLLGRPIMEASESAQEVNPIRAFYNGLAQNYDAEQESAGIGAVRRLERELVSSRLKTVVNPSDRVLEIGAGSGRFTLPLAHLAKEVVAVEISGGMLERLKTKAGIRHISNIVPILGDIERIELEGTFDVVCCFSAFEYISDLGALLARLAGSIKPGGRLYFTTAHRSLLRFFAQIGNAMRQGLWLHSRSTKEIRSMLSAAGLEEVEISTHGLKCLPSGGVLIEVLATKKE